MLICLLRGREAFPTPRSTMERVLVWQELVVEHAVRNRLDPALVLAVVTVESGGRSDARSPKGAVGLMQLMPATAEEVAGRRVDRADPATSIELGTRYLARMVSAQRRNDRPTELALVAYNAGPGNLSRWLRERPERVTQDPEQWVPYEETRDYLARVRGWRTRYRRHLELERRRAATLSAAEK